MATTGITTVKLQSLPLVASGKVRELYRVDDTSLLMAVTDRISAYDEILSNGVPDKGHILCQLSSHWFDILRQRVPELKHHVISMSPPAEIVTTEERALLRGRCMHIRSLKVFPIEAIVRGYITGSAWSEYSKSGTVHGIQVPNGLELCQEFPGGPMYTPSTKAPIGEKDENISPEQARKLVGDKYANQIEALALKVYKAAHAYALERGIVIADTKMEFASPTPATYANAAGHDLGLDEKTDEIILVDEVLTPDCSRFWPAPVQVGKDQPSYDKQYIRDYLTANGLKGKPGVVLPDNVVAETTSKYREVFEKLAGKTIDQALSGLDN
ncbi:phosphoribosylaminoimidazole-succinocarboxamide synthase [Cordyceps militaris]|uniref:Phosphoribosylaminoimidazole-succinocarboxamide synthase n=1 Tax=Cordyceps militaris TaxID=73501 RepID=A0A2H4SC84_CORMI|nr:phosphoribosylaminoimidazole-succinocarboxamide synthase [Cordyceps militaris]